MSSRDTILAGIARLRTRWWCVHVLRHALQALFYLLLVGALVLLVFEELALVNLVAPLLGGAFLAGLGAAFLRRPSEAYLAKAFDDQSGLQDRVSSTVELLGQEGPMVDALTEQAAEAAKDLKPAEVYPYAMPREGWWMPVPALLVAAVLLLPSLTDGKTKPDPELKKTVEEMMAELAEMTAIEQDQELSERQKELLEKLLELQSELDHDQLDKKDTMAEVAKVLEELEKARAAEEQQELELKELLKSKQEKAGQQEIAEMIMDGKYAEAMKKLQEELEKLKEQLEEMKKEGANPDELKQLEALLADMEEIEAKMMELLQLNMDLDMMGEAIEMLAHFDGELGELGELDPSMMQPGEP